jgi:hypothetical protein
MIFGSPPIVTSGLVLNLDAGNTKSYPRSGTVWRDLSGNNNSGSLVNGPTFNSQNGGSIVFDGVDDYVGGSGNQITGLIDLTVSAWVYPVTSSATRYVSRYYNTTANNGFVLYSYLPSEAVSIKFAFDGRESVSEYLSNSSSLEYPLNQWYNVVGTKNANNWRVYVNSILVASNNVGNGTTAFQQNNLQVGALVTSFGSFYTRNSVANAQIYNRALTPTEVQQNYNALKSRFNLQ